MSAGRPSVLAFILPLLPFNFIAVATDTHAHALSAFAMMDSSLLPLLLLHFPVLIQAVGGVAQRHY